MRYQLNEKLLAITNSFKIKDEAGNLAYQVVGKFFAIGHNLSFESADGTQLAQIKQRLITIFPKYEVYLGDKHFATITKEFTFFKDKFTLDVPGPNDYVIKGSFLDYEYQFHRGGKVVAEVSRKFWSITDSYGVDIVDGEDDVSILATVVVVDLCCRHSEE